MSGVEVMQPILCPECGFEGEVEESQQLCPHCGAVLPYQGDAYDSDGGEDE
jgi:predicted RNA-binding Zn-ribbon protein involved in translation (DUF1610 family)